MAGAECQYIYIYIYIPRVHRYTVHWYNARRRSSVYRQKGCTCPRTYLQHNNCSCVLVAVRQHKIIKTTSIFIQLFFKIVSTHIGLELQARTPHIPYNCTHIHRTYLPGGTILIDASRNLLHAGTCIHMHLGMCGYVRGMGVMRCTADAYACVGMCVVCAHHFLQHFLCILCGMCGYVRMHLGYVRGMCVMGSTMKGYVRANVCMCRVCAGYARSRFSPQGYVDMALENNV